MLNLGMGPSRPFRQRNTDGNAAAPHKPGDSEATSGTA